MVTLTRKVTGDPDFHLHHLRHSFATWHALAELGRIEGNDFSSFAHLPKTQAWLHSAPQEIDECFLGEPTRRNRLYLVSRLMGHASPGTTLEHYIHGLDILLRDSVWEVMGPDLERVGWNGLGLTHRTFQRWKGEGWQGIQDYLRQKAGPGRVRYVGAAAETEEGAFGWDTHRTLGSYLEEAWETLGSIERRGLSFEDPEVARRYPEQKVQRWGERVDELQARRLLSRLQPIYPSGEARKAALKAIEERLDAALTTEDGPDELRWLCETWVEAKSPKRAGVQFDQPETARKYHETLKRFGFTESEIIVNWLGPTSPRRRSDGCRAKWRRDMGLSRNRKIPIVEGPLKNPEEAACGRIEVVVKVANGGRAESYPFNWVMMMAYIIRK